MFVSLNIFKVIFTHETNRARSEKTARERERERERDVGWTVKYR